MTLDELDVEIHFVKENEVISRSSPSSDKLAHGMTVVMAKHFIDNLSEETLKGMTEKARAGIYPSYAPIGYRNADGPAGKRILVPDAHTAPVITELFDRFSTGRYSLRALVKELNADRIMLRGRRIHSSRVHQILRKRIYTGVEFDWNGVTYASTHEPLVTRDRWERVQELLNSRAEKKTRKVKHDFAYTGLVRCGHCGCLLVGEIKKGRYIYYHCTDNRGKCQEPYTPKGCSRPSSAASSATSLLRRRSWNGSATLCLSRTERRRLRASRASSDARTIRLTLPTQKRPFKPLRRTGPSSV